jgi:hypothetical protein
VNCQAGTIASAITGTVSTMDTHSRVRSDASSSANRPGPAEWSPDSGGGVATAAV